jgi:hypothetical protein
MFYENFGTNFGGGHLSHPNNINNLTSKVMPTLTDFNLIGMPRQTQLGSTNNDHINYHFAALFDIGISTIGETCFLTLFPHFLNNVLPTSVFTATHCEMPMPHNHTTSHSLNLIQQLNHDFQSRKQKITKTISYNFLHMTISLTHYPMLSMDLMLCMEEHLDNTTKNEN